MMKEPVIRHLGQINGQDVVEAEYVTEDLQVTFLNIGASIVSLKTKDEKDQWDDIVLGYDDWQMYPINTDNYMGSVIGRCANRIGKGKFNLNGKTYQLAVNNGPNHLHGGDAPFNTKIWKAKFEHDQAIFTLHSPDGEGGYPGNLNVKVTYRIGKNAIEMSCEAVSDQDTLCNLTNHTYFNLDGHKAGSLKHHQLMIDAKYYLPSDETLIPTGQRCKVDGTPFDFRVMKPILQDIEIDDVQLRIGRGYDHTFELDGKTVLWSCQSKRMVTITTTLPGIQLYTGNYLDAAGKGGARYGFRSGVALETQFFPDSINQPDFLPCILKAGEVYHHQTIYVFGIKE